MNLKSRNGLGSKALIVVVLAAVVCGIGGDVGAQDTPGVSDDAPLGRAERVLVFTVPTLSWQDLADVDAPNLEGLLEDSVVGDLSVRSVTRRTSATDGYATLNAGTRTEGTPFASLAFVAGKVQAGVLDEDGDPTDLPPEAFQPSPGAEEVPSNVLPNPEEAEPDPQVLPPDSGEKYEGSPAAEEFARRTGVLPEVGDVFNFGLVSMRQLNEKLLFGSEVGALGEALSDAGVSRAVIANGDHGEGEDDVDFRREASVGLMDRSGLIPSGRVGRTLLENDSAAPFGTRYDNAEVAASFKEFWTPNSVVLVEASDMVRYEDSIPLTLESQRLRLRTQAIQRSDLLLGRLLEDIDLERDAVVVVAPYATDESTSLTVVGVHAPEVEAGELSSGTTRRPGFVQTVDIAPSILSLVGADIPSSMEGTLMERRGSGGDFADRQDKLVQADTAAKFRDSLLGVASTVFVVAQLVLWGLALLTMSRSSRLLRTATEIATLAVLTYLPVTFLAGAFPFHVWGAAAFWGFVIVASGVSASLIYLLTRRYLVDPLIATLGLLVAFLSIDIVLGGPLQFNTIFGYTPTVAGRFNGMGNPAFSMITASVIMLAALVAHRIGGRKGAWAGIALLGWVVVLDGAPFLGADVGGALALVPSAGVTAWMLLGLRIKARTAIIWGACTALVVVGFGILDLNRAPAKRSHLGRLFADIGDNGFEAFQTVVLRKLNANLSVLTSSVWTLMLPLVFAFVGLMFWWAPWRLRTIEARIPQERAAVAGLLTAMVLGFALNDSGISVPGMMLGVVNAALVHLLLRVDDGLPRMPDTSGAEGVDPDAAATTGDVADDDGQLVGSQSGLT